MSGQQSMTDLARYQDPLTIQRVLHTARTIATVSRAMPGNASGARNTFTTSTGTGTSARLG